MLSLKARLFDKWNKTGVRESLNSEPTQPAISSVLEDECDNLVVPLVRSLSSVTEGKVLQDFSSEQLHFIVDYIGSAHISEAQSVPLLLETLKRIKKQQFETIRVDFTILDGVLKVSNVETNALLLTAPLYAVSLCAKEQLRGYEHTFGMNITRKKIHMCHAFQAGSKLEAASIVRSVALAFKVIGKMIRDKQDRERKQRRTQSTSSSDRPRTNSEASSSTVEESLRKHHHIHWKHSLESSSEYRSPLAKRKPFGKSSTSPSILRQSSGPGLHSSGRHFEFASALSPVPSDSSISDGEVMQRNESKENLRGKTNATAELEVPVDIHHIPDQENEIENSEKNTPKNKNEVLQKDVVADNLTTKPVEKSKSGKVDRVAMLDVKKIKTQLMQDSQSKKKVVSLNNLENNPEFSSPGNNSNKNFQSSRMRKISRTESFDTYKKLPEVRAQQEARVVQLLARKDSQSTMKPEELSKAMTAISEPPTNTEKGDDEEDVGPLIEAVQKGNTSLLEKKLDDGVSVNARDSSHRSLLYHAVMYGQTEVAQLLIRRGAEVNWEGPDDKSPLHVAAAAGNRAVTQLLLENGANVRAKDSAFCTPLHMSAGHLSNLEVSYLLMEHGARIFENNLQGLRPVDLEPQLREMQRLLVQSACEAFTAGDLTKSRSNSGASSSIPWTTPSGAKMKAAVHSPRFERIAILRNGSFQRYRSSSFCSNPDLSTRWDSAVSCVRAGIKRSESMHISLAHSPRLGQIRRTGLRRSRSFQKDLKIQNNDQDLAAKSVTNPVLEEKKMSVKTSTGLSGTEPCEVLDHKKANEEILQDSAKSMNSCVDGSRLVTDQKENNFDNDGDDDDDDDDDDSDLAGEMSALLPSKEKETYKLGKNEKEKYESHQKKKNEIEHREKKMGSLSEKGTTDEKESLIERESKFVSVDNSNELIPLSRNANDLDMLKKCDKEMPNDDSEITSFAVPRRSNCDATEMIAPDDTQPIADNRREKLDSSTRQCSIDSDQTACVLRSVSECEASSLTSTGSHAIRDEDQVFDALVSIVLLSGNPECHSHLLAYLCLPKASGQLCNLVHAPVMSVSVANHVAVLIGNLFNLEGTESRKRSVEAGLIKTVLKLVDCQEPIQSTCLTILQNILDFDNDREYSTALSNIPLDPLLNILQVSDADSGAFDMRPGEASPPTNSSEKGRIRQSSICSRASSFDDKHREMSPVSFSRVTVRRNSSGASEIRDSTRPHHSFVTKRPSLCSMGSFGDGEHAFPSVTGHLHQAGSTLPFDLHHNKVLSKLIATKMLAATSMHSKMQLELGKLRPLSLLTETLHDANPEIVASTSATLANIALNISNHIKIEHSSTVDGMRQLLNHNDIRVCYHAARCLIYLGHLDTEGVYLFDRHPGNDRLDVLFAETTGDERLYVRGASIEKIVEIITKDPSLLWGGVNLPVPSSRGKAPIGSKKANSPGGHSLATEEQIVLFVLTTYKSYVHPLILMRILLHRFYDPWFDKYFDGDPATGQVAEFGPLPTVHIRLMRFWKAWLEKFPQDFLENPVMATELSDLILPMKKAGGPYQPCADNLEKLLSSFVEQDSGKISSSLTQEDHCHHSILYEQCQKAVVSGSLPCTLEDAAYLSALQLYIEDLCPAPGAKAKQKFFPGSNKDKLSVSRIKQSLNPSFYRVKNMGKRVKYQHEQFVITSLSERNAKHNYIDCCQNMPGYGCKFFRLKEYIVETNRKGEVTRRLLGVNPKRLVLLDEKTKAAVRTWNFKDLKRWNTADEDTRLRLEFSNLLIDFQLEEKAMYKDISDTFLACTNSNWKNLNLDFTPWGKFAEETQLWGEVAKKSITPVISNMSGNKDGLPRGRACSAAALPLTSKQGSGRRHVSISGKLSSSAPHYPEALSAAESLPPPGIIQDLSANTALNSRRGSSVGPSGAVSTSTGCSTDELIAGSLQSTLGTPQLSWEGHSFLHRRPSFHRKCSRESSLSIDEPVSPAERNGSRRSSLRHRYMSSDSNMSSPVDGSPNNSAPVTPSSSRRSTMSGYVLPSQGVQNLDGSFALSPHGQLLICHCPPDAELPSFDRRNFTAYNLLQYPKELARQITLIDHEYFFAVTAADIQKKIAQGTGRKKTSDQPRLLVERLADRFNQLSMWVVSSILEDESVEHRATMFIGFIETAKQCLELRNYNAVMAIVAALGSAPIRRLAQTKELVPSNYMEQFAKIEMLMETKNNYKRYREILRSSPTPAVPYFGIYMKDLTFIMEGNPDFLKGGLINLTKRRQVFIVIDEVSRFQKKSYNFQEVPEIREYLLSQEIRTEAELHKISRLLEPAPARRHSDSAPVRPVLPQFRSSLGGRTSGRRLTLNKSSSTLASGTDSVC